MNTPSIFLLGGYGNTGTLIARLLLQETDARVVIAGRSEGKAAALAAELNAQFGPRAVPCAVDAADPAALRGAFPGARMVVAASSTARYARTVAEAALDCGLDYYDVQYSSRKIADLQALAPRIQQAGRCFITDGGFHPGLPAALIRYAAARFDHLESALVASWIQENWAGLHLPDDTVIEMVEEFQAYQALTLQNGQWKPTGMWDMSAFRSFDFGAPFGKKACAPMFLEELRHLPAQIPTAREMGFYVGSFNWFVDWFVLPLVMFTPRGLRAKLARAQARLMRWGLTTFTRPPYRTILQLEARGQSNGSDTRLFLRLAHADGYAFTAIPVVAALKQYFDGSIARPGLHTQANLVEPARLIEDMRRMGVEIQE